MHVYFANVVVIFLITRNNGFIVDGVNDLNDAVVDLVKNKLVCGRRANVRILQVGLIYGYSYRVYPATIVIGITFGMVSPHDSCISIYAHVLHGVVVVRNEDRTIVAGSNVNGIFTIVGTPSIISKIIDVYDNGFMEIIVIAFVTFFVATLLVVVLTIVFIFFVILAGSNEEDEVFFVVCTIVLF